MNHVSIFQNLFPEDSRIAEYCSALSLIFMSFLIFYQAPALILLQDLSKIQRYEFWGLLSFSFGLSQFLALLLYQKIELLRCVMAIVNGCLLVWISIGAVNWDIQLPDVGTFAVGIANLYAFVINTVQIKRIKTWES